MSLVAAEAIKPHGVMKLWQISYGIPLLQEQKIQRFSAANTWEAFFVNYKGLPHLEYSDAMRDALLHLHAYKSNFSCLYRVLPLFISMVLRTRNCKGRLISLISSEIRKTLYHKGDRPVYRVTYTCTNNGLATNSLQFLEIMMTISKDSGTSGRKKTVLLCCGRFSDTHNNIKRNSNKLQKRRGHFRNFSRFLVLVATPYLGINFILESRFQIGFLCKILADHTFCSQSHETSMTRER